MKLVHLDGSLEVLVCETVWKLYLKLVLRIPAHRHVISELLADHAPDDELQVFLGLLDTSWDGSDHLEDELHAVIEFLLDEVSAATEH